jgi:hypothetical protein
MMPASHASRIAEECPYRASGEALQDLGGFAATFANRPD